jgi:hypothetical protein
MLEINYKMEGVKCLTSCPFKKNIKVNSGACQGCRHFRGDWRLSGFIKCLANEKQRKIPSIAAAKKIIREQNEEIGRLVQENSLLERASYARKQWTRRAKEDAGYPDSVSFDHVWVDALAALNKVRSKDRL